MRRTVWKGAIEVKRLPAETFEFPRAFPWNDWFNCSLEFFDGRVSCLGSFFVGWKFSHGMTIQAERDRHTFHALVKQVKLGYEGGIPPHHSLWARTAKLEEAELADASSVFVASAEKFLKMTDEDILQVYRHRNLLIDPQRDREAMDALRERLENLCEY